MRGDIGDGALVARLLAEHKVRAVLNFAAESHVDRSIDGPGAFIQTNVVGTLGLLEAVRDYWKALPADKGQAFRFLLQRHGTGSPAPRAGAAGSVLLPRCRFRTARLDAPAAVAGPGRGAAMIGVLVPAHDEAATIGRCLRSLQKAARHPGLNGREVRIVVALDACSDSTAVICRELQVETIDLQARCVGAARAAAATGPAAR